jgi:hypothetical protein
MHIAVLFAYPVVFVLQKRPIHQRTVFCGTAAAVDWRFSV